MIWIKFALTSAAYPAACVVPQAWLQFDPDQQIALSSLLPSAG
jgi:hypothetical protein